jgi:hypothetical protein
MTRALKERSNMSTETNLQPRREDGYERRDANVRRLIIFGLILGAVLIVVLVTMKWTFDFLSAKEPLGPPPTPFENVRALPPQPRLQTQPHQDLKDYCEDELKNLETYGWVDPQNGIVRIPVDAAMQKILQQGLPSRPVGEAASAAQSNMPATMIPAAAPKTNEIGGQCYFVTQQNAATAEKAQKDEENH